MGGGRGSASASVRACLVFGIFLLLGLIGPALGAIYTVGGAGGWNFNVNSWPNGKSFKSGDILAFNYDKSIHNVVEVDKKSYDSCSSPKGAKVSQSGKDRISLKNGSNYFICSVPGHCQAGMKIDADAS